MLATGGVDPGSKDNYGYTPLSRAAGNGHEAVVKLLEPFLFSAKNRSSSQQLSQVRGGS
jgi:ankyrin repeat protein